MRISQEPHPLADRFITELMQLQAPKVLELGTKRWDPELITHHRHWAPHDALYVMGDIEAGEDVDIVMDAHQLTWLMEDEIDAFIAVAVWEHLKRPWIAAQEVERVMKKGGICYIQTHMAFPYHGYPDDYTRWTANGLTELFESTGLRTVSASHTLPCKITPPFGVDRWNWEAPAWLCVDYFGRKP